VKFGWPEKRALKTREISLKAGNDFLECRREFTEASDAHTFGPGLPDFTWYNLPKREQKYQINTKYTKWP
jgi:hypothetical protein